MLIKSNKSDGTLEIERQNRPFSTEGRALMKQEVDLQKDVQGSISDIVREHRDPNKADEYDANRETQAVSDYIDSLYDKAPKPPPAHNNKIRPATADTYAMVNGRLTLVRRGVL